jgi:hypothetical protein
VGADDLIRRNHDLLAAAEAVCQTVECLILEITIDRIHYCLTTRAPEPRKPTWGSADPIDVVLDEQTQPGRRNFRQTRSCADRFGA